MKIGRFLIYTALGGGLIYTIAYFIRNAQLLKTTSIGINGIKVNKLGEKSQVITTLKLENKSDIPFTLHGGKVMAVLNGLPTADILIKQKEKISAHNSTLIPLEINFNLLQVINSLKAGVHAANVQGLQAVNISIRGDLSVSSGVLLFSSIPVDLTFNAGDFIKS